MVPPYIATRSATMASPSPLPGVASSSRTPRASTACRCPGAMPGPSSTTVMSSCAASRLTSTRTVLRAQRQALSSTLPSISCRSCSSPAKAQPGGMSPLSSRSPRSACTRDITRSSPSITGATAARCPGSRCAAAARACARCQSMWRRARATCSCTSGASAVAPAGEDWAAWSMTASGVFSAWARLPAWVRARSTTSALRSSTPLKSSISGCTSAGKRPCRRWVRPSRTSASAPPSARKGDRPTPTCARAAKTSKAPSAASEAASTPVNRPTAAAFSVRSAATIRRQAAPGGSAVRTVRSSSISGASCGPRPSCRCSAPSASASSGRVNTVSHKERERSSPRRVSPPGTTRSSCQ